ncbi:MAG: DUF4097 family beta strand repeat-containing protein [Acidobacteriota bacterium]
MMHRPVRTLALTALAALLPLAASAAERTWANTYSLDQDGSFALENINGDVVIEAWDRDEVDVQATITSKSQEAVDEVEIEVDASGDSVDISTDYPERKGRNGRYEAASVAYHVRMPRLARAEIELVNGDLRLDGVAGAVDAELVNGDLTASGLAGNADLTTVNGEIHATFDQLGSDQRVDIESVNGSVDLYLPSSADAVLEAETVHGDIESDFELTRDEDRYVGQEAHGRIGAGGGQIDLENVNGTIRIHRQ